VDREFLSIVSQATFSNPFGEERDSLDHQISGGRGPTDRDELLQQVVQRVAKFVDQLDRNGSGSLRGYAGADRDLLEGVFLFDAFHRFTDTLDALIREEIEHKRPARPTPFGDEVLGLLSRRGFPAETARRYLEFFYQLRRAFRFIDQSLIGRSPSMRKLRFHLWNNVFTSDLRWYARHFWNRLEDFSTLLLGETGTGKGTVAAAIGRSGYIPFDKQSGGFAESCTRTFLAINLSQFPESLIESELFGHRKGAFTGAIENHDGVFSRCTPHGSIFLDEIGDLSIPSQIKILQVLQERTFSPVGGHEVLRFSGRVIAATNRPLDERLEAGQFRDDLYYRLCSDVVTLPPLRQRIRENPGELDDLIAHLLRRMTGDLPHDVLETVRDTIGRAVGADYPWPGNVRELEQAVRRIVLTRHYAGRETKTAKDLVERLVEGVRTGTLASEELLAGYCSLQYQRLGSYEAVAKRIGLDRRTVKKYVELCRAAESPGGGGLEGS
jgi:DNA-binding NtrC family response regulator